MTFLTNGDYSLKRGAGQSKILNVLPIADFQAQF
jgi:hypothetical protein